MSQIDFDRGAALSLRVKISDRCRVILKNANKTLESETKLSRDQLKNLRDGLRKDLKEFQVALTEWQRRPLEEVGKALYQLYDRGRTILNELFGDRKLVEAMQMCRAACPNWEQPGWDPTSFAPHLIEIRTSLDYGIPFDLLPLLNPLVEAPFVRTMDDLARLMGSFLGFSFIVRRTFTDALPGARRVRIDNMNSLPLKMFWKGTLPQAQKVKGFFEENGAHFDLKGGPWPNGSESKDAAAFCKAVAGYLEDPESSFDGGPHQSDQLCYFFCHCDTSSANPEDYTLHLDRKGRWIGSSPAIRLQHLTNELRLRNQNNILTGLKREPRPLVFLNACASADLDPAAAASFPKLFLSRDLGFLGFIGAEATVPEAFAATFAETFYRHFVGGLPLGRALLAARWHMLRRYHSPLGILYTLYADPEIEVRKKVESLRERLP